MFALFATILSTGLWLLFFHYKSSEHWWYDTIAAFPAGMWFSFLREKIEPSSFTRHLLTSIAVLGTFVLWRHFIGIDKIGVCSVLFSIVVILFSTWVKLDNSALQWLGNHCFSIYMLQRIPMIILSHFGWQDHKIVFTATVLVFAFLLAWGFKGMTDFIDKKLFA